VKGSTAICLCRGASCVDPLGGDFRNRVFTPAPIPKSAAEFNFDSLAGPRPLGDVASFGMTTYGE